MNCYAIDIPEPRAECPRYAEAEESLTCIGCGESVATESLAPWEIELEVCGKDRCNLMAARGRRMALITKGLEIGRLQRELNDMRLGI